MESGGTYKASREMEELLAFEDGVVLLLELAKLFDSVLQYFDFLI